MNRKKLRQLAKQVNHQNKVDINFVFAPADYFCYQSEFNILEVSSFYHRLPSTEVLVSLVHEIGHMNTVQKATCFYMTDYTAEYEANRWALNRLDELQWDTISEQYKKYLKDLSMLEVTDEDDEEYQEAATALLLELELI